VDPLDHVSDGYRRIEDVSYPCFTSRFGNRIELREGIWNGSGYNSNLKLINRPVLKTHDGTGMTGSLKHTYGTLSMTDGNSDIRHYSQSGSQCGKMWGLVRPVDLNIIDCIWVSLASLAGYPREATSRRNLLLAGLDPAGLDYYASEHVLLPLSKNPEHDPDSFDGLIAYLEGARDYINASGGIRGMASSTGDANFEVVSASASADDPVNGTEGPQTGSGGGGGSGGCFIATAAYGSARAKDVVLLQRLRDDHLRHSRGGTAAISFYYAVGSRLADFIAGKRFLRRLVRLAILPVVRVLETGMDKKT
jgi:hypothetical protein